MQNFMKTIINAIKSWTNAKISDVDNKIDKVDGNVTNLNNRISNSVADWNEMNSDSDSFIKNKPDVALRNELSSVQSLASQANTIVRAKMNATNPVGTGSFSMNRKTNTVIGNYSHAEGSDTTASGNYSHAEGHQTTAGGDASHAEGDSSNQLPSTITNSSTNNEILSAWKNSPFSYAKGDYSHVEGQDTLALGGWSHAEGSETKAIGQISHAEGYRTRASGIYAHAEGDRTEASAYASHAEGEETRAINIFAHAEGTGTLASGPASHAEGNGTQALGRYSHAEGYNTTATHLSQHAQGEYNILDLSANDSYYRGTYAHIVGNGTSDTARSNAHTLDWNGNAWYSGDVYVGSTSGTNKDEGSKKLATENMVNTAVSQKSQVQIITWGADD